MCFFGPSEVGCTREEKKQGRVERTRRGARPSIPRRQVVHASEMFTLWLYGGLPGEDAGLAQKLLAASTLRFLQLFFGGRAWTWTTPSFCRRRGVASLCPYGTGCRFFLARH